MQRRLLVPGLAALLALAACNSDKVLAGRRALATEPAKAIALFQEAEKARSPCFDCKLYTGLAYEKTGDLPAAATAWEAAIAIPDAAGRQDLSWRLLDTYEKLYEASKDKAAKAAIARKAATLETSLGAARAWANEAIAEGLRADLDAAKKAGRADGVKAAAAGIQALYLPSQRKREMAVEATEALRTVFAAAAEKAFKEKVAPELAETGRYDPDTNEVVLTNRFVIPPPSEDEAFDPKADGFKVAVRKRACVPLREGLGEMIAAAAPAVGAKTPDARAVDAMFAAVFPQAKAGFAAFGGDKKPPAGQTFLCTVRLPLASLLGELFRYSE
ncbi:MAG: hypothetical protein FJ087_18790 [Deltaproteobacteria bacterium]|nr:hypothetical protein [Deltaproteobacteria bacterium]